MRRWCTTPPEGLLVGEVDQPRDTKLKQVHTMNPDVRICTPLAHVSSVSGIYAMNLRFWMGGNTGLNTSHRLHMVRPP
jgi:hypothetical protein